MITGRKLGVVLLGVCLCLTACFEKKKPETILKGEVGTNKISTVQDMFEMAKEEKISTVKMDRHVRDEKERWKYADQRRRKWVNNAMESGFLESEYIKSAPKKQVEEYDE